MATGTVKWFSGDKGYGFITPVEPGGDRQGFHLHDAAARAHIGHKTAESASAAAEQDGA